MSLRIPTVVLALSVGRCLGWSPKVSTGVLDVLASSSDVDVVVSFRGNDAIQHLLSSVEALEAMDRSARLNHVHDALQQHASTLHQPLIALLEREHHSDYASTYINGKVYVRHATEALVDAIASLDQVAAVDRSATVHLVGASGTATAPYPIPPSDYANATTRPGLRSDGPPWYKRWSIDTIEAPTAWTNGIKGAGVVVATIGTGVRATHEALQANFRSELGWFDPISHSQLPVDTNGTGSHAVGVIAGTKGHIGVAPEAKWIACAALDASGSGSEQHLIECAQFLLCPTSGGASNCALAPHVVYNSWSSSRVGFFDEALGAWRAGGIIPVFAAGDNGNGNVAVACGTITYPASSPLVLGVGATSWTERLFASSFRGPTADNRVKPDLSAPGEGVVSADWTDDEAYTLGGGTMSSAAHVAGAVALYLSQHPAASFDQVRSALTASATTDTIWPYDGSCGGVPGTQYPNHGFGAGRVNVRALLGLVEQPTVCKTFTTMYVDYPGNDIKTTAQRFPQNCCADCVDTPNCLAYVWAMDRTTGKGTCWLKHSADRRVFNTDVYSGVRPTTPTTCSAADTGVEFVGLNKSSTLRPSADLCCRDCQVTPDCRAFTWSNHEGGTCWLKTHRGDRAQVAGAVSGFIMLGSDLH